MVEQISRIVSGDAKPACMGMSRASSLDVMKCFAAFCVVWIHFGNVWLIPLVRCAVPIFFMITGYYYPMMVEKGKFWKHIKKLLLMLLCSSALYGIYALQFHIRHDSLNDWLASIFSLKRIIGLIVFNRDLFSWHLWYFWAVLYDLLIIYVADKLKLSKWLKYLVPVLLLFFFIGNYFTPSNFYFRNFLFMGLPCMMIGRLIIENEDKCFLLAKKYLWFYTLVCLLLIGIEMLLGRFLGYNMVIRDMYVFTLPLILPYFYLALNNPSFGEGSWLASIGKKYSAYIYIFHVLAATLLSHFLKRDESWLITLVYPFLVFTFSLLMAWLFRQILQKFSVS